MIALSAHMVSALQARLVLGEVSEEEVCDRLRCWARKSSPAVAEIIGRLLAAFESADLRSEMVEWRALEVGAPHGFPSEFPVSSWRFDPTTGAPLPRYERVRAVLEAGTFSQIVGLTEEVDVAEFKQMLKADDSPFVFRPRRVKVQAFRAHLIAGDSNVWFEFTNRAGYIDRDVAGIGLAGISKPDVVFLFADGRAVTPLRERA